MLYIVCSTDWSIRSKSRRIKSRRRSKSRRKSKISRRSRSRRSSPSLMTWTTTSDSWPGLGWHPYTPPLSVDTLGTWGGARVRTPSRSHSQSGWTGSGPQSQSPGPGWSLPRPGNWASGHGDCSCSCSFSYSYSCFFSYSYSFSYSCLHSHPGALPPYQMCGPPPPRPDPTDQGQPGVQPHVQVGGPVYTGHGGWKGLLLLLLLLPATSYSCSFLFPLAPAPPHQSHWGGCCVRERRGLVRTPGRCGWAVTVGEVGE